MTALCHKKNPLTRNGTNQWGRFLKTLNPDSVKVDGRSAADMVMFAKRLSQEIKFYDKDNAESVRHWKPFFSQNLTSILAQCETLPVQSFLRFSQDLRGFLLADPKRSKTQLRHHFQLLFFLPVVLLRELGELYEALPQDHALRSFIAKVVIRDIDIPLRDLFSFYKGALPGFGKVFNDDALQLSQFNTTFDEQNSRMQLPSVVTERITSLSGKMSAPPAAEEWLQGIHPGGWTSLYDTTAVDAKPYRESSGKVYHQIYDALTYNLVTKAFDRLFQALERVSRESSQYLNENLTSFDKHPPHYALWLTFLRLFSFSQAHLNTLSTRHLDFYYSDILQLPLRKGEPHKVHVLFELNKNSPSHLLTREDTFFKGGKDDLGREVSYQLDEDMVINRAKVESLKSLYSPSLPFDGSRVRHPFAAPVTNSQDGSGESLLKDHPHWKPFGPLKGQPDARIGFAIADKQLFLREGHRTIDVKVTFDSDLPLNAFPSAFKASLTTEEGWFDVFDVLDPNDLEAAILEVKVEPTKDVHFIITLKGEDPAIIPFDPAIHEDGFSVSDPVLKIEYSFGQHHASDVFTSMGGRGIQNIELAVQVSGVRQVTLQNDFGQLDTNKPFLPFGPTPQKNSFLTLGSSEIFSKKLEGLTFHVEWETKFNPSQFFPSKRSARTITAIGRATKMQALQASSGRESRIERGFFGSPSSPETAAYTADYLHLKNGKWERPSEANEVKLFESDWSISETHLDNFSDSISQTLENEPYSNSSSTGFLRLELQRDFGHKDYPSEYTVALIDLANGEGTLLPQEPYTPKMSDFTLDYVTQVTSPAQFFHLYPFGFKEISVGPGRLFSEVPHEGTLYIGVKDLEPPQRLSLLFQTVDGSANPLKPENTVKWAYLKDNEWVNFEGQEVDDKTHNLTGSGIVGLAVPEGANTTHTILPSGLFWLRMAVQEHADALNDLLSIDAQAATVTFHSQNNDPQFLSRSLEPGTISKLKVSQGAVKKISQPYPSFGGKSVETREHFYVRVSERLRHKDRASTMWDYEHLVLEHFSNVYKVKCINHTELCRDLNQNVIADNELRPGHVLVVPVPFVTPGTAMNPLRPFMDKKTITAIDRFLRTRISPFIQLEVQNSKIEEVQIHCRVAFTEKIADKAFYKEELEQAIIRYLTPWAYGEGVEISFGGRWHKSAIINFVEEQDYVDFVKDFEMYHKTNIEQPDNSWTKIDQEIIEATTARSILVSHGKHIIQDI